MGHGISGNFSGTVLEKHTNMARFESSSLSKETLESGEKHRDTELMKMSPNYWTSDASQPRKFINVGSLVYQNTSRTVSS